MPDLITFGEIMIRFSPMDYERLEQTMKYDARPGGSEANVAIAAHRLGLSSGFVTKLPNNELGWMLVNKIREHGVDVSRVVLSKEGRVGLYFVEFGAKPRAQKVVYDRAHSSISMIKHDEIDWKTVFSGAKAFHVSGITPALSSSAAEVTFEAMKTAKQSGLLVSFDLNYRKNLWTGDEAQKVITPMMEHCDVLITTEEDTEIVFKIKEKNYEEGARVLAEKMNFEVVAITLRETPYVMLNNWTGIAYSKGKIYKDVTYEVEVIDRVGAGDSFTGGFIYGYLHNNKDVQTALQYGVAMSALKHSIPGDFNWCTKADVDRVIKGAGLRIAR